MGALGKGLLMGDGFSAQGMYENIRVIAQGREETEACQKGTAGCCVDHDKDPDDSCECW
jgi:hypothetical protein